MMGNTKGYNFFIFSTEETIELENRNQVEIEFTHQAKIWNCLS